MENLTLQPSVGQIETPFYTKDPEIPSSAAVQPEVFNMISARGDIQSDSVHNHQNGQFVMSESTMMSEHVLGREQAASGEPRYTAGPISGDQSAEIVSFDPFESAKRVCSCFKRQLDNMTQLYNLARRHRHRSSGGRFSQSM